MMAYSDQQGVKLVGYCECLTAMARCVGPTTERSDFTGASNATFSLSLSLVTGNVGGNTKKMARSLTRALVETNADRAGCFSSSIYRSRSR